MVRVNASAVVGERKVDTNPTSTDPLAFSLPKRAFLQASAGPKIATYVGPVTDLEDSDQPNYDN